MMATKTLKKITPKGERLGWTPLKEVKPVVITAELMKAGRAIVSNDRNSEASANNSFLIPCGLIIRGMRFILSSVNAAKIKALIFIP